MYTMYRSNHNIIPLKSGSAKNIYNVYNVGIQWRYTMYIYSVYNVYNVQIQPQHYPTKIRVCEDTFPRFPYSTYPAPSTLYQHVSFKHWWSSVEERNIFDMKNKTCNPQNIWHKRLVLIACCSSIQMCDGDGGLPHSTSPHLYLFRLPHRSSQPPLHNW